MTIDTDPIGDARARFADFLDGINGTSRLVIFCHFDADGLAAGALFGRALARHGFGDVCVVPSRRGENAFTDAARERLRALAPTALLVTDLGVDARGVLPGIPTAYVDHHRPNGVPFDATVVSAYGWERKTSSAWLAWQLLSGQHGEDDDIGRLAWLGAVGAMSDFGDEGVGEAIAWLRERYTAKWLKEAVALVNAARRASAFDTETPLALLMRAEHPREIAEDTTGGAERLRAYRVEVNAALAEARRGAPTFATGAPWALLRMESTCQVHPLIAQQWRTRLPKYVVLAANRGYLPGIIAFSARTSRTDLAIPPLLQAIDVGPHGGSYGHGHDQASGGQLPPEAFVRLCDALGFPPEVRAWAAGGDR
jgi:single-stranded-DNA-specific exonuclease